MPSSSGKGDEETAERSKRRRTEVDTVAMYGGIASRWSARPYLAGEGNRADGDLKPRESQGRTETASSSQQDLPSRPSWIAWSTAVSGSSRTFAWPTQKNENLLEFEFKEEE
jgi:hypothetical protein